MPGKGIESVQVTKKLDVVHGVIKKEMTHFKECLRGQEGIRSGLMLRTNSRDLLKIRKSRLILTPLWSRTKTNLQLIRNILQSTLQIFARLHEVLDVVDAREINRQDVEKVGLVFREGSTREELQEVAKVVATVLSLFK